jgi:hypothetical protein
VNFFSVRRRFFVSLLLKAPYGSGFSEAFASRLGSFLAPIIALLEVQFQFMATRFLRPYVLVEDLARFGHVVARKLHAIEMAATRVARFWTSQ